MPYAYDIDSLCHAFRGMVNYGDEEEVDRIREGLLREIRRFALPVDPEAVRHAEESVYLHQKVEATTWLVDECLSLGN